jgi:hypothetical protein
MSKAEFGIKIEVMCCLLLRLVIVINLTQKRSYDPDQFRFVLRRALLVRQAYFNRVWNLLSLPVFTHAD